MSKKRIKYPDKNIDFKTRNDKLKAVLLMGLPEITNEDVANAPSDEVMIENIFRRSHDDEIADVIFDGMEKIKTIDP